MPTVTFLHFKRLATGVVLGLLLAAGSCAARQSPLPLAPASLRTSVPAKAQPKRVWTDENIIEVRTVADVYQDQKAAAAEAARKQAAEQSSRALRNDSADSAADLTIPKTEAEITDAIDLRKGWLENCQSMLLNTRQRLSEATDPVLRKTLEEKARLIEQDIVTNRREIQTLEKAKSALQNPKEQ